LENIDWLIDQIEELEGHYVIFDCPGQIELYTHHKCVQSIVQKLQKTLDARLCSIHLVDSYYCSQPHVFISAALHCASTMLRLGLPHVNVLSKVDLLTQYGDLPFNLDFFTEMNDLQPLLRYIHEGSIPTDFKDEELNDNYDDDDCDNVGNEIKPVVAKSPLAGDVMRAKFYDLTAGLCEILEDFGMINFTALNIEDAQTVGRVLVQVDKANGYCFAASEIEEMLERQKNKAGGDATSTVPSKNPINQLFRVASQDLEPLYHKTLEIQEKYTDAMTDSGGFPSMPIAGGIISSSKRNIMAGIKEDQISDGDNVSSDEEA
jgi:hypothetical protein